MDEIEEIKRRIDIVDFISGYLTLKKAGANYRSLCPFHQEKTPSMMISPEKQIFKCFGCGEGGDVLTFIQKMENLEFREALEMLAERAGVKLEKYRQNPNYQKEKDQKTSLYQINQWSARLFHEILLNHPSGKGALDYLKKRKLTLETIKSFSIGYAPPFAKATGGKPSVSSEFLHKKGYSDTEIQQAGGPDRFYRRIIFPIRDVMGNCIGFTGRATVDGEQPKYLNTPETIIFHKGRILYNLEKARGDIKLEKATVVVEGQMDVIASSQAGVKNVVATSGTALTEEHLRILYRYTPNIIFAFDSDTAGMATAKKAYEMALVEGMNVKMVELGKYKDPGEMAVEDPALWQKAVKEAKPVIDWYFGLAFGDKLTADRLPLTAQKKKEIAKELMPIIKKIPDPIEQAHYIGVLAKKLGISEQVIFDALNKENSLQSTDYSGKKKPSAVSGKPLANLSAEEALVGLIIHEPSLLINSNNLGFENFPETFIKQLYTAIGNWYTKDEPKKRENLEKYLLSQFPNDTKKIELLVLSVEEQFIKDKDVALELVFESVAKRIRDENAEKLKQHFAAEISRAESEGNRDKLKQLIREFQDAISQK